MKQKRVLSPNSSIDQFVAQDFPVVCDDCNRKHVKVVELNVQSNGNHKAYECSAFHVEVLKDYNGHISFLVIGDNYRHEPEFGLVYNPVWIMRTDDFNRAYDLKNKLAELTGDRISDFEKMPCYGSLQREALWWERENRRTVEEKLENHHFDSKKAERTVSPTKDLKNNQEALDEGMKHFHGQPVNHEKETRPASGELSKSDSAIEEAAWDNFQGKLLHGHDLFKFQIFNLKEEVYSEAGPFDETQMEWWINNITRCVNNNPDEAAGFTILTWDRDSKDWVKYSSDGVTTFTYDTGRRTDGICEQYKQQVPSFTEKNSLLNMLSRAQQTVSNNQHKSANRSKDQCIE